MKLYRSTIALSVALFLGGLFVGCTEDATLEGADQVYITLNPSDIVLRMGDTVRISAEVANLSGAVIETPITWSIDKVGDEEIAVLVGDTAVTCLPGTQGKNTKLRALLKNGQYGLANISVVTHTASGIHAVDTAGNVITSYRSYFSAHDSVVFTVAPKELLEDFTPTYTLDGVEPLDEAMTIDKVNGRVAIHFISPRKAGGGSVALKVGDKESVCEVLFLPQVFATFYGEKYAGMPYIDSRPDKSTLSMYFAYVNETNMDVNSESTVRVAFNVQTGADEDIEAAYSSYRWEFDEEATRTVTVQEMKSEYVAEQGFDAVLKVRSIRTGTATFRCITPDTVLTAIFTVQDYVKDYPVEEITVDKSSLEMVAGEEYRLKTGVEPMTSYAFHKPVVTVADPTIATVGEYDGNLIPIRAIGLGSTELILTANGKELRVPLTVREDILNVTWEQNLKTSLFEGQSTEWGLNVLTATNGANPYGVIWNSTDESKVKVVAGEGDKGVLTAVAVGSSDITATVDDKTSTIKTMNVVAATDRQLTATDITSSSGILFVDNDLEIYITTTSYVVKVNAIGAGPKTGYAGTYTENLVVTIKNAQAEATGTVTVTEDGGKITTSFDLTVNVGDKSFTVKATDLPVSDWK